MPRASSAQDVCDNSNDSGLGFEERQQHLTTANVRTQIPFDLIAEQNLPPSIQKYPPPIPVPSSIPLSPCQWLERKENDTR